MNPNTETSQNLPRVLGPWIASAIVVGTVIGSGVFKKGQNVAERVPEFGLAISAWVLGGVLALLGALTLAEIAVLYPRAGGNYVFLREGFGRLVGFIWGWVEFWIIRSASIAALATMFVESLHVVLTHIFKEDEVIAFWPRQCLTVLTICTLAFINAVGTRIGGGLQFVITLIKVGSLIGIILLPILFVVFVSTSEHMPSRSNFYRIWPQDWSKVNWGKFGAALVGVLWAYHGWMNIGPVAGEVRHPQRNIPIALIVGVFLLIALYVGANVAYYTVIPQSEMATLNKTTVATQFCLHLLGPVGAIIASAVVMTSVFGSLNGNLLVGPRLLFAMARDRLAPTFLGRIAATTQTPAIATAVLALWSCVLVIVIGAMTRYQLPVIDWGFLRLDVNLPKNKSPFDVVTDFAMFGAVALETLAVATIFVFRIRYPDMPRPYRCLGYPIVPIIYCYIMLKVLENMFSEPDQRVEAMIGFGFILVGITIYTIIFRKQPAPA